MRRLVGLTRKQLELRERVLEGLVTRALRQTVKTLTLRPLVAATAGEPPAISTTAAVAAGEAAAATLPPLELATVPTTWQSYVTAELYPFLVETYLAAGQATAEAVQEALGVPLPQLTQGAAEAYLASAKNRLAGIGDDLWSQLRTQLAEGYSAGESTHQLAARIRQTASLTEPRALVIARTEVIPAANAASLEQVQLAFTDEECSKEWLTTTDDRTREAHRKADGQRVPINQSFTVGGEALPYPGWPGGSPENVIQCRCTVAFVFTDDAGDEDDDLVIAAVTRRERTWTPADESKHERDARGRFARKSGAASAGKKLKLRDVIEADTGDDDAEIDPDTAAEIRDAFTGEFRGLRTGDVKVSRGHGRGSIKVSGTIFDSSGSDVGMFTRQLRPLKSGDIEAEHVTLLLNKDVQGQGFAHAFNKHLFDWYRENGVSRVRLLADSDVGGYAWARAGYDWQPDDVDGLLDMQNRIDLARRDGSGILKRVPAERREEQRRLAQQLYLDVADTVTEDTDPDDELPDVIELWPTPFELSQLGRWEGAGRDDWWIGKSIMMDSNWWGVRYLDDVDA